MAIYLLLCAASVITLVAVVCVAVRLCDLERVELGAGVWKLAGVSLTVKGRTAPELPRNAAIPKPPSDSLRRMATAQEVAQWMVDHIRAEGLEYRDVMLQEIADRFGDEWTPPNENGNPIVSPAVLRQFAKLHGGTITWADGAWSVRK